MWVQVMRGRLEMGAILKSDIILFSNSYLSFCVIACLMTNAGHVSLSFFDHTTRNRMLKNYLFVFHFAYFFNLLSFRGKIEI